MGFAVIGFFGLVAVCACVTDSIRDSGAMTMFIVMLFGVGFVAFLAILIGECNAVNQVCRDNRERDTGEAILVPGKDAQVRPRRRISGYVEEPRAEDAAWERKRPPDVKEV